MKAVKLNQQQRTQLLEPLLKSGWTLNDVDGKEIIKKLYQFKDFKAAFAFMTQVALHAEQKDHHPEWFNVYNRVDVGWSTHECNGLSERDIAAAQFCDSLQQDTAKSN
ncbi:hypothetical protein MP228_012184 [Amoeboaphelidium protococcarum]|nr:hypothetical protein MP228_012184 [Amoeboaphelidium protococcarum]